MVEQNPITRVHPIRLPVVHGNPVTIEFSASIGRSRVEGGSFALRCLNDLAIEFRSRRLVEPNVLFETTGTNCIQEAQCAQTIDVAGIFGHFEGDFDMGLGPKVVDLGRLNLSDDVHKIGTVA